MRIFTTKNKDWLVKIFVVISLFAAWQMLSMYLPSIIFPSPLETAQALLNITLKGKLVEQLLQSSGRMFLGLSIGFVIAIIFGLLAGKYDVIYEAFRPIHSLLLGLPPIIIVVLAMVWFGTGSFVPVFVVSVLVFPGLYLNTAEGWRNIDRQLIEMAAIYRSSPFQTVKHIILPGLAVPILTAVSLAVGSAVRITIMAELLGSDSGIGYALALARVNINTAEVFAWTIICIFIIIILDYLVINPFKKFVLRWNKQEG